MPAYALGAIVRAGAMPGGNPAEVAIAEVRNALLRAEEAYRRATGQPMSLPDLPVSALAAQVTEGNPDAVTLVTGIVLAAIICSLTPIVLARRRGSAKQPVHGHGQRRRWRHRWRGG